jgi:hypothetical protein
MLYTPEEFEALANSELVSERCIAASDYFCPQAFLVRLSTDKSSDVRARVASNVKTPPLTLLSMSTDESIGVRYNLLWNHNTAGRKVSGPIVDSIPRQHLGPWTINGKKGQFIIEAHKLPWAYGVIGKTPVTL